MPRSYFFMLALLLFSSCSAINNHPKMSNNPMLCDPDSGICEMPATAKSAVTVAVPISNGADKLIQITYFTDPICSSCWGIEPQLRRMKLEYGDHLHIEYRMGGLLPDWNYNSGGISKPSDVAGHWDEVSYHYDMPIDGDVWLEDPLPSSYPPSIAFKAAQIQDEKKAIAFMRRIREMVFLEKKNIARWEHLEKAALETGLDAPRMKTDMEGTALQAFQKDLELSRSMGVRGFPTLFFSDASGNRLTLYGAKPYAQFEQNLRALLPDASKNVFDASPESLFAQYPTLTSREFATLSGKPRDEAERVLSGLFQEKKLSKTTTKNGVLWIWAKG
jgi:predicted DsbA family dithiol-disulfide isomerase